MRTFDERNRDVQNRLEKKRRTRRRVYGAVALCCVLALALVLFVPLRSTPPSVAKYSGSPYYSLIYKINDYLYEPPAYANRFEMAADAVQNWVSGISDGNGTAANEAPSDGLGLVDEGGYASYVEVTDNQVEGVTEGDLFKRSDRYIFYLTSDGLKVYTIDRENSQLAGSYSWTEEEEDWSCYWADDREMYLSEDCSTVTLLLSGASKTKGAQVLVISLDVQDPAHISRIGSVRMDGSYLSSRTVDGKLMILTQYRCYNPNLEEPESFVPALYTAQGEQLLAAEDIYSPDTLSSLRYTVLAMLDQKSLEVTDTSAFLSYSDTMYVSGAHLFATRAYSETTESESRSMTQITCLGYGPEGFTDCGSVNVEGSVKNQYSMDEQDGVLRIVTSTSRSTVTAGSGSYDSSWVKVSGTQENVNLSCYSIADWSLIAQVEAFAPEGDQAESVRFDGDKLYVCTAVVVQLTDPVYFFDLSDYNNIQYTDTGVIGGYSSSLVQFGGSLLGIGYGDSWELKVEIYEQGQERVEPICSYTRRSSFSEDYKSYFIDRENRLVGLAAEDWDSGNTVYLLLHYNGYDLYEVLNVTLGTNGDLDDVRATEIDGWLYILWGNELYVREIK